MNNLCSTCKKRSVNLKKGLICSLTDQPPTITDSCSHFEAEDTQQKDKKETSSQGQKKKFTILISSAILAVTAIILGWKLYFADNTPSTVANESQITAFAKEFETALNNRDLGYINQSFSFHNFAYKIMDRAQLKSDTRQGYFYRLKNVYDKHFNVAFLLKQQMGKDGFCSFRKLSYENEKPVITISTYSSETGYILVDFELSIIDGKVYIHDVCNYETGIWMSENFYYSIIVEDQTSINSGDTYGQELTINKYNKISSLFNNKAIQKADSLFQQLPAELQSKLNFQLLNISISSHMGAQRYRQALTTFKTHFSTIERCENYQLFSYAYIYNETDSADYFINKLKNPTNNDPLLIHLSALNDYSLKRYRNAIDKFDMYLTHSKDLDEVYELRLIASAEANAVDQVIKSLNLILGKFEISKPDLISMLIDYPNLIEHEEIQNWLKN